MVIACAAAAVPAIVTELRRLVRRRHPARPPRQRYAQQGGLGRDIGGLHTQQLGGSDDPRVLPHRQPLTVPGEIVFDRPLDGRLERALIGPSAFYCKHPPQQFNDDLAAQMVDEFIADDTALAAE